MIFSRTYSLNKSRHILQTTYDLYLKKKNTLDAADKAILEKNLLDLEKALNAKDKKTASAIAHQMEDFNKDHFKKSFFAYGYELIIALLLALVVATVVRQMWFELYEIPTGSMRPTFKEQDHLTVSKLAFGINIPLETNHFYFDPNLMQRTSVVIFSGDKIPYIDQYTTYFWLIPYKKRYIKRDIGKPGDSIYFYGGKLYGVDKDGHPIKELLDSPWMNKLEHIPFMSFEGIPASTRNDQITFNQMLMPTGRLTFLPTGNIAGEVFNGKEWVKDQPGAQTTAHNSIQTYSDFFGMRNFAMARLLNKQQLAKDDIEDAPLYLELRHNPSLTYPKPTLVPEGRGFGIFLTPFTSVIPLQQHHLDAIMDNMYTARFVVKDGRATPYNFENTHFTSNSPRFPGVPDGTYEFYFGKAFQIGRGGIAYALTSDHPLYKRDVANIQRLYNLGIDLDNSFSQQPGKTQHYPRRYAYFRKGDLYLLGAPVLKKDDPTLAAFNEKEQKKEKPYVPFQDYGPPLNQDGSYNTEFIRTFGVKVPDNHYFVLGDNHAMSSDSRVFGFVPENNMQGTPSIIIWPPDRIGLPEQKPYPIFNLSRLIVWTIAFIIFVIWYYFHHRRLHRKIGALP